jgi:hypothetical protein
LADGPRLLDAAPFAGRTHANQRRKGAAQEPSSNHLLEAAQLVAEAAPDDDELVVAGLLHDVMEDCGPCSDELAARFGARVAAIVTACSDDMSLPKPERKRRRLEHAVAMDRDATIVKTADLISHLTGMERSPPAGWPIASRLGYVDAARVTQAAIRGACPFLDAQLDAQAARTVAALHEAEADPAADGGTTGQLALDPGAGQPVHLLCLANTEAGAIGEAERQRLADLLAPCFPSVTLQDAQGLFEGRLRPILLIRLRSDSTEAVVALAQQPCVTFQQRFVGLETEGRYLGIYADDTA